MPEIQREATATTYWFNKGKFQLEEKEQISEKLGESPDLWDAFCLTFAQPVAPRTGLPWVDGRMMRARMDDDEDRPHDIQRALTDEN